MITRMRWRANLGNPCYLMFRQVLTTSPNISDGVILVSLLDLSYEAFDNGGGFYVISCSGYLPRSVNIDNIATRHEKERLRYEMGQAVEIKPNKPTNEDSLFDLGFALIKVAKTLRMQRLAIGIGCKMDRLYIELRPMTDDDNRPIDVWDSGNTNLFSRLLHIESLILNVPVITARYTHKETDELLFDGVDNPSPILEIVEQELEWRAEGHVNVYLENAKDVNAFRNVLKIQKNVLMMYNKQVTDLTLFLDPEADEDDVTITLQRKVEQWSGSVCPSWSRLVTTPYTIETISHSRKRRSVERSKDRNKMKFDMKNWEVEWMLKS